MAIEKDETKKTETTMSAPTRSTFKTFAMGAGAAATGALGASLVTGVAKAAYTWAKGDKKETAKAALGGVSGLLKLK